MKAKYLFLTMILAHASIVPMIMLGTLSDYMLAGIVFFFTGCLGMSMTYHRLLTHRSWKTSRFIEYLGTLFGVLGLTGSPIAWCAVHREHHRFADREKDPHSPHSQPWWQVQFLSMFHTPNLRLVRDLIADPFHKFVHRHYFSIQLSYVLILALINPFLIISAYLFPAALLWQAGSSVNTLGHIWGYRSFDCGDRSLNNFLLGVFFWGEGWHNNHHRFPKSPYYGQRWYELDVSGWLIFLLNRNPQVVSHPIDQKQKLPLESHR